MDRNQPSPMRRALCAALPAAALQLASAPALARRSALHPLRIYHVMSFDSPWRWTDGQLAGFREGLAEAEAQFRIFQMNVKRNATPDAKAALAAEAWKEIERWQPDLIYTSDDDALSHIGRLRRDDSPPLVFSGANRTLAENGLNAVQGVTGVLEQEHFGESMQLLRSLVPGVRRLAVITDTAPHWGPVMDRIRSKARGMPFLDPLRIDTVDRYGAFQSRVRSYQAAVDAVLFLGIFNLKDEHSTSVPYQTVQRWVVEHSRLPDLSFWIDRIHHGVLCSVTVSERAQGLAAGRLARAILIERKRPEDLPILPTVKGRPAINLARARQLGIRVNATELLSAEVVTEFEWDKAQR